jgi:hypothetical protein
MSFSTSKERLSSHPEPIEVLLGNRAALGERVGKELREILYTPPSREHYPHLYLWDSCFVAIVYARHGYIREAVTEVFSVVDGMDENGMIPNMIFAEEGRKFDPERPTFMNPAERSDYSQPPVLAQAVSEIYQAMRAAEDPNAEIFLSEMYPRLKKFYGYFEKFRQNAPDDQLVGVIHPHETGRDSDPTFDFFKMKLFKRRGKDTSKKMDLIRAGLDYASVLALNCQLRAVKWNPEKARELFWVNDIMFNCIYVDNLMQMSELASADGKVEEAAQYQELATTVEGLILDKMWFPEAREGQGAFYALNNGEPLEEVSVSNLFPLLLPNLQPPQLESILNMLDSSFDTDFPIPSVATDSPNYDPNNQMVERLWRGGTWMNTNWYLVEHGLRRQAAREGLSDYPELIQRCRAFANKVAGTSNQMADKWGYPEFSHPETGEPQRTHRVKFFSWGTTARLMDVEENLAKAA